MLTAAPFVCFHSLAQERDEWQLMSEQADRAVEQPASDETIALSAAATAGNDGALATRLPRAVSAASNRIVVQVRPAFGAACRTGHFVFLKLGDGHPL